MSAMIPSIASNSPKPSTTLRRMEKRGGWVIGEASGKSEYRNPKSATNSKGRKSEKRMTAAFPFTRFSPVADCFRISCFGFSAYRAPRSGGGGIRTHGTLRLSGFQDRRNRPLCHPSLLLSLRRLHLFFRSDFFAFVTRLNTPLLFCMNQMHGESQEFTKAAVVPLRE